MNRIVEQWDVDGIPGFYFSHIGSKINIFFQMYILPENYIVALVMLDW